MKEWPERFVYVTSATGASVVNVLPLVHAGIERVAKVILFCGVAKQRSKDAVDRREATDPAEHFAKLVKSMHAEAALAGAGEGHNRPVPEVLTRQGLIDDVGVWQEALDWAIGEAKAMDLPLLFNVTGGTRGCRFFQPCTGPTSP